MNKEIGLFEVTREKIEHSLPKKVQRFYETANIIHIKTKMKCTK